MAVPVYQTPGAAAATTAATTSVAYPATVNPGDLLVLAWSYSGQQVPDAITGWTKQAGVLQGTTCRTDVWTRIADGSETGTVDVTIINATAPKIGRMFRITGTALTVEAVGSNSASDKNPGHPSVTTTGTDRLVLAFCGINDDETAASYTGETGGDFTLQDAATTALGSDHALSSQTATLSTAGTISGGTWSYTGATEEWATVAFAVYEGTTVNPTWDQDSFRIYDDDNSDPDAATALAAVNTNPTDITVDQRFLARFLIQETAGANTYDTHTPRLQFRIDFGGGFGSWALVGAAGSTVQPIRVEASPNWADNTSISQLLGSGAFRDGTAEEGASNAGARGAMPPNGEYEIVWSLIADSNNDFPAEAGDRFQLRVQIDSTDLDTYTNTVDITLASGTVPQSLSATAVGVASIGTVITYARTLSATAVGAAVLTPVTTFLRTLSATVIAIPALTPVKMVDVALSAVAAPVAALSSVITYARTLSATAAPAATLTPVTTFVRNLSATAVAVASVSTVKTILQTLSGVAVGVASVGIGHFRTLAATAVGSATLSSASVIGKALTATAVGVASIASVQVIGKTLSATATGVATLGRSITFVKALAATATGVASFQRTIGKTLAAVATGNAFIVRLVGKTLSATATPVATLGRAVTYLRSLPATATGAASLASQPVLQQTLSATAAPVASLSTNFIPGGGGGGPSVVMLRKVLSNVLRKVLRD